MTHARAYIIIGVDGGGTGCRAAIRGSGGTVLGTATGGPANYTTAPETTIRNVRNAILLAAAEAGLDEDSLTDATAHIGLAGILTDADARAMGAALPIADVTVTDDRPTSAAGALGPDDGALAAIGTGSFVAIRRNGATRAFGGWGLNLGDQASGARLGRTALERCLLAHDGLMPPTELTRDLMAHHGGDPAAIVAFARTARPDDYAALAPMIVTAASTGDAVGRALMQDGAAYLTACFAAANLGDTDAVCLMGSLGPHYEPYLNDGFRARIRPPRGTALDGALDLAAAARSNREPAE